MKQKPLNTISIIILMLLSTNLYSQVDSLDQHTQTYGFTLGMNQTINGRQGFILGINFNYPLTQHLIFQPQANLVLGDNGATGEAGNYTGLEVPLHLKYYPCRKNLSPYYVFGINPFFELAPTQHYRTLLMGDLGIGMEIKLEYFTISPEVRYSYNKDLRYWAFLVVFN